MPRYPGSRAAKTTIISPVSSPIPRVTKDALLSSLPFTSRRPRCSSARATNHFVTITTEEHIYELEVSKSKFLAFAFSVDSSQEALERIKSASDSSASHNCFAYKIGSEYRFNDDGEPSGTAGRPILAAIEGEKLDHVAVLIVRYYGGVKLGTGGLARAYGQAARDCLRACGRAERRPRVTCTISLPFASMGAVYGLLDRHGAVRTAEAYSEDGGVALTLSIEMSSYEAARAAVQDVSGGKLQLNIVCGDSESDREA